MRFKFNLSPVVIDADSEGEAKIIFDSLKIIPCVESIENDG